MNKGSEVTQSKCGTECPYRQGVSVVYGHVISEPANPCLDGAAGLGQPPNDTGCNGQLLDILGG
jgi:hypothetical protein